MPKYAPTITTIFDHQSYQKKGPMVAWPFMEGVQTVRKFQFISTVQIDK